MISSRTLICVVLRFLPTSPAKLAPSIETQVPGTALIMYVLAYLRLPSYEHKTQWFVCFKIIP